MKQMWQKILNLLRKDIIKNVILAILFLISLCAILAVQFHRLPIIKCCITEETAQAANTVLLTLSYSYLAALVFYLVTSVLPAKQRRNKLKPIIERRIHQIGRCIRDILLEFSRDTDYGHDVHNIAKTEAILKSKDWFAHVPLLQKYNKVNLTYLQYMVKCGDLMNAQISDLINKYHEEMTAFQLVELENLSASQFFDTVGFICTIPDSQISSYSSLFNDFIEMQQQYLRVEKEFKIKN